MQTAMTKLMTQMSQNIQGQMQQSFSQLGSQMESALKIDATAFQKAIQFNMSEDDLTDLMKSAMLSSTATYDSNLQTLGYADLDAPSQIKIYPQDFEMPKQRKGSCRLNMSRSPEPLFPLLLKPSMIFWMSICQSMV